jgi:hypothetical protein
MAVDDGPELPVVEGDDPDWSPEGEGADASGPAEDTVEVEPDHQSPIIAAHGDCTHSTHHQVECTTPALRY